MCCPPIHYRYEIDESDYDSDATTANSLVLWEADEVDGSDSDSGSEPEHGPEPDGDSDWEPMPEPESDHSYIPDDEDDYDSSTSSDSASLIADIGFLPGLLTPKRPKRQHSDSETDDSDNISYNRKKPRRLVFSDSDSE